MNPFAATTGTVGSDEGSEKVVGLINQQYLPRLGYLGNKFESFSKLLVPTKMYVRA